MRWVSLYFMHKNLSKSLKSRKILRWAEKTRAHMGRFINWPLLWSSETQRNHIFIHIFISLITRFYKFGFQKKFFTATGTTRRARAKGEKFRPIAIFTLFQTPLNFPTFSDPAFPLVFFDETCKKSGLKKSFWYLSFYQNDFIFLAIVGTRMRWVFWLGQFLKRPICARVFLAYVRIFRDFKVFERNF